MADKAGGVFANYTYAHMCRMGHTQIGHNDSENEMCPVCVLQGKLWHLKQDILEVAILCDRTTVYDDPCYCDESRLCNEGECPGCDLLRKALEDE